MSESFVTPTDRLNGPSLVHVQFPNNSQQVLQILTTYRFAISDHYRSARLPPNVARFHQYLKCENAPLVHFMDAFHFVNAHCVINLNRNPTDEEYNSFNELRQMSWSKQPSATLRIARENPATRKTHTSTKRAPQCIVQEARNTLRSGKQNSCRLNRAPRRAALHNWGLRSDIARRPTSRSPTGILTENLAGPELLASSAIAAEALATPCLGGLLRGRREHGSEAWSGGAGKATWWWWQCGSGSGGAGRRRWSAAGAASISRRWGTVLEGDREEARGEAKGGEPGRDGRKEAGVHSGDVRVATHPRTLSLSRSLLPALRLRARGFWRLTAGVLGCNATVRI